jgi:hypothetical protein
VKDAIALVDLAREVILLHNREVEGGILVIPVIVASLEEARPILAAIAALTEGLVIDSTADDFRGAVAGTDNVARRTGIETALGPSDRSARRVVLVSPSSGLLDAEFRDPPAGPIPSAGERSVLALARAAAHADLDRYPLVVLAYRAGEIDVNFIGRVWSLGTRHLSAPHLGTLRTLVFVCEGAPEPMGIYCQTGFLGFRFAVQPGRRLLHRFDLDTLRGLAGQIANRPSPFVLFLGAGFSASSNFPLGDELRSSAIRRLLSIAPDASADDLARRFHRWMVDRGDWLSPAEQLMSEDAYIRQLTLEQVIRAEARRYPDRLPNVPTLEEFRTLHDRLIEAPGSAPTDLSLVLRHAKGRVIVAEVNFDLLIERWADVPLKVFVTDEDFARVPDYLTRYVAGEDLPVPLLKFHGSIERPETCIVSAEQTDAGLSIAKAAALRSLTTLGPAGDWLLYVGMSMRDRDLVPVLGGPEFAGNLEELWVTPYPSRAVDEFGERRRAAWLSRPSLGSLDARLITESADVFFAALAQELT